MGKTDRIHGIVISMPTPTKGKYELDLPKLKNHIQWVIDEGMVEGKAVVMAAAGLGTGYFLTREEHQKVMKTLVDAANGRVPTATGIFDTCTKEAVTRAKYAQDVGIDLLQMNTPHYMAPTDDEVVAHYKSVNDASECGIMAYNTPWASMNFDIRAPLLERLMELDNFVSLKWTSNDPSNLISILKNYSKRLAIVDNSSMPSLAYSFGAKAYIPSFVAHIAPKVELHFLSLLDSKKYQKFDEEYGRVGTAWKNALAPIPELNTAYAGEGTDAHAYFEAVGNPMGPPVLPQWHVSKESVERFKEGLQKNHFFEILKEYS